MTIPLIGIVDDDTSVRDATSSLIRSAGYTSVVFESAEAFLNSGRVHEMDCLVLDIQLPGLNGLDLQRRLAEMRCTSPVIVVSADHETFQVRALEQGAVAVLKKPFSEEAFFSAIRSALKSSGTEEEP